MRCVIFALISLAMFSLASAAQAKSRCQVEANPGATRLAIVIGNGAYQSDIGALKNPANDARAVSAMFKKLGLTVATAIDASAAAIDTCIARALKSLPKPDVATLYYSGHGIQSQDANYLVALDADPTGKTKRGFVAVDPIVSRLQDAAEAVLVFLDACRNNPIAGGSEGLSVSTGRNLKRGFVPTGPTEVKRQTSGLLVAYATSPNAVALDGQGDYSPFTEAILKTMPTPGFSV